MNAIRPGQLVQFDYCGHQDLIGKVERIIPDSEPSPLSTDYLAEVNICGQALVLVRMSELRPMAPAVDFLFDDNGGVFGRPLC